jgi:hypothetical protein
MDAAWAVPEWAPADESHLLGSSSPVMTIRYNKGSVTYTTFDPNSIDVLRLDFVPESVMAAGRPLTRRPDLSQDGFTFDESTRVLRIRHDTARDIDIQGQGGAVPPLYVTFDDPHLPAGTALQGLYPLGAIDWGSSMWEIAAPQGKFGTFNLQLADQKLGRAALRFYEPRVFAGIDAYNAGASEAMLTIRSPEIREISFAVKPGELRRIRTGWSGRSSSVIFEFKDGEGLRFDNLAYTY